MGTSVIVLPVGATATTPTTVGEKTKIDKDRKVAVLDFDGVLNTYAYLSEARKRGVNTTQPKNILDPSKVALLNEIEDLYHPQWVLSTSWAISDHLSELQEALKLNGFKGEVVHAFPFRGSNKYDTISQGLEALGIPRDASGVAILEDDESLKYTNLSPLWVQTDPKVGLTGSHLLRLSRRWKPS